MVRMLFFLPICVPESLCLVTPSCPSAYPLSAPTVFVSSPPLITILLFLNSCECGCAGSPQNQLAVVATYSGDMLECIYRYFRALMVTRPFTMARENLKILFEKNRVKVVEASNKVVVRYMCIHICVCMCVHNCSCLSQCMYMNVC